jgi:hypothetical protein
MYLNLGKPVVLRHPVYVDENIWVATPGALQRLLSLAAARPLHCTLEKSVFGESKTI